MKKKLLIAVCILAMLLSCMPAQASTLNNFFVRTRYGELALYQNYPYHYEIGVYEGFYMYPEAYLDELWADMDTTEEEDEIFDFRLWTSPDRIYTLQIQVKEQTYDSFATEVKQAPHYMDLRGPVLEAEGYTNIRPLHSGIIRKTPVGDMLEIAYAFSFQQESGKTTDVAVLYYDCYYKDIEYIFELTALNGDYIAAQQLLDAMVQTLNITYRRYRII